MLCDTVEKKVVGIAPHPSDSKLNLALDTQKLVEIIGISRLDADVPVQVFKVHNGTPVSIAQTMVNKEGKFGFIIYPDYEGLYELGTGNEGNSLDNHNFWLKEGDKLAIL